MQREQRKLEEILGRGGLLAKVVEGYDVRPQQLEMGTHVLEALFRERILVVEAPTGVGKTVAYLVPAALHARAHREPVVVSSYTRNLQDQILQLEAPRLRRLVHPDLRISVLKGRANYLCRRRWDLFVEEHGGGPDGRWAVEMLEGWVHGTATGAFSEAPELGPRTPRILPQICGDPRFCRSRLCRPETGCFHKRARREAREADIVVVNHSLLLADLFSGGGVLPEHRVVIVDEAHVLPAAALDPLSRTVSERSLLDRILQLGGAGEPGVSDRLRRVTRRIGSQVARRNLLSRLKEFEGQARELHRQALAYFAELRAREGFPAEGERRRYGARDRDTALFPPGGDLLCGAADRLLELARHLKEDVQAGLVEAGAAEDQADSLEASDVALEELREQVAALADLLAPDDCEAVYVMELSAQAGARLSSTPLETGPALREHLLDTHAASVFTSATLAAGDDFGYFERQVGLGPGEAVHLRLSSPFDLDHQLLLLAASHAVDPRDAGYEVFLAETIGALLAVVRRKALVLFTAHRTLRAVWASLAERADLEGLEILGQSREVPRARLAQRFREAQRAVLLGSASFWQGVDFPGRELELLVVTRLPFPVPTDPRVEAISERLDRDGGPGFFAQHALPEAVLRMRQGVGRLIRRRDDRGACVVLDRRIMSARYGSVFRAALPSAPQAVTSTEDLVRRVRDWFGEDKAREPAPAER